jgi:hypothetical protein
MCSACVTFVCLVAVFFVALFLFEIEEYVEEAFSLTVAFGVKGLMEGLLIPAMNALYDMLAQALTSWEHHQTRSKHEASLASKKFTFEYINAYVSLFWIAFFRSEDHYINDEGYTTEEMRMHQLAFELAAILITGQLINLVMQVVMPLLCNRKALRLKMHPVKQATDTMALLVETERQMLSNEAAGTIDEHLEMIIQFGYVTMFVAAFPLAPLFCYLNNCIEIRVDACKLVYIERKPETANQSGIGIWGDFMKLMSVSAVVVNCALLWALSENGVASLLPDDFLESLGNVGCPAAVNVTTVVGNVTTFAVQIPVCDHRLLYQARADPPVCLCFRPLDLRSADVHNHIHGCDWCRRRSSRSC